MIHLYYTYSVSKLPYGRAFISATSNREFPPDFLKTNFVLSDSYPLQELILYAKNNNHNRYKYMNYPHLIRSSDVVSF